MTGFVSYLHVVVVFDTYLAILVIPGNDYFFIYCERVHILASTELKSLSSTIPFNISRTFKKLVCTVSFSSITLHRHELIFICI